VIPTVAPYLLPPILPALRERHPKLRLVLREEKTDVLVRHLHEGELDVLLLALEADLRDCETLSLFSDPFLVALPASHPLAEREAVSLDDLEGEPLLLLEEGHCLRDQSLPVCDAAGVHELEGYRASSLGTLVQMVAGGLGLTFVPEIAADLESRLANEIVLRPIAPAEHSRTIALAWRASSARGDEFRELGASIAKAYGEI
jgi:LysR family hydrogen peroxide-inducible transcriptional activator